MPNALPPFAQWLNNAMAARDMTQADLARKLTLNDSQVSRWRRGVVQPGLAHLERLAEVFGIPRASLEDLVGLAANNPTDSKQSLADPVIEAQIVAGAREMEAVLREIPPSMHTAYIKACRELGHALSTLIPQALSTPTPENEPEPETPPQDGFSKTLPPAVTPLAPRQRLSGANRNLSTRIATPV